MTFKYQTYFDRLSLKCPPLHYQPNNIQAFRWVFDSIEDEENFSPQYHRKPKRFLNSDEKTKCQAMGLSMFDTLYNAKQKFIFLKNSMGEKKAYEFLGTKIAEGHLLNKDGVNSLPDKNGHFTYHPSENVIFVNIFSIVENNL